MFISHETPVCAECGASLEPFAPGGPWCLICNEVFCANHLTVEKGVGTCSGCVEARRLRELSSGISDADEARVVSLLARDIANTVGPGHEADVEESAARQRLFCDSAGFEQCVVEEVQQYLHDCFIDTSWPRCPEHPKHPLWYSDGWWCCEQTGKRIAALRNGDGRAQRADKRPLRRKQTIERSL